MLILTRREPMQNWRQQPEVRVLMLGLPLELLWEIAQFPLYTVWYEQSWTYILYSLLHCTFGDLLILLIAYEAVALAHRNRRWFVAHPLSGGLAFTLLGVGYTIYSEIKNVRIEQTWGYTAHMPIVPLLGVGLAPLLQWVVIPPLLIGLLRKPSTPQINSPE